ncbi:hypothetical protein [Candidatus Neoehrlichia procyonis]|uniref:Uncharacterized protein n=1 Tax=Candidatus Neoehrlichia procyonis str. RAC413 TaxID=1359163 RepID=A0A0F3NNZ9_9RICK|nr:hypothetical protein [Candidatus Neoehrlichia lotoris]KJV69496.1 hypothetical protein NLO413_0889 [Candidatus Neoehrlichia lotoris str. RAC413]
MRYIFIIIISFIYNTTYLASKRSYASIKDIRISSAQKFTDYNVVPGDMTYIVLKMDTFRQGLYNTFTTPMSSTISYKAIPGKCISYPQHNIMNSVISYLQEDTIPLQICACRLSNPCSKATENLFHDQYCTYEQLKCKELIGCTSVVTHHPIEYCDIIEERVNIKFVPLEFKKQSYFHPGIHVIFSYGNVIREKDLFLDLEHGNIRKTYTVKFHNNDYQITVEKKGEQLICASYTQNKEIISTCEPTPALKKPTVYKINNTTIGIKFEGCVVPKNCHYSMRLGTPDKDYPVTLKVIAPKVTPNRFFPKHIYCSDGKNFTYNNISDIKNIHKQCNDSILPTVKYLEDSKSPLICIHNINFESQKYTMYYSGTVTITSTAQQKNTQNNYKSTSSTTIAHSNGTLMHNMLVPFYKNKNNIPTECSANNRGAIFLHNIPQNILNKIHKINDMYQLPQKYVRQHSQIYNNKKSNPCIDNNLLFSYQNTRIQYNTQGKAYSSPYLDDKGNIYEPKKYKKIIPQNPYDQELCINNFKTYEYSMQTQHTKLTNTANTNSLSDTIFDKHIQMIEYNGPLKAVPNNFDHRISLNDNCDYLKIESWGGTERGIKSPVSTSIIHKRFSNYPIVIQIKLGRQSNKSSNTFTKIVISSLINPRTQHKISYITTTNAKTHIFTPTRTNFFNIVNTTSHAIQNPNNNNSGMVRITCEKW